MTKLRISPDLSLPAEAVTETFAVLAKRGAGKTYTASVMVEELLKSGQHVVVVDPLGVWWGLRASADGKGPGQEIVIFGGDHGDVPLEDTAGQVIADLVVGEGISVVLDLSSFRKASWVRFVTDFAEQLYRRNREPLHLVLDEADSFAPQRVFKGGERMLGAMEDLVRRGRARGIGITMVTQRSASINKDLLTQAEVLVALRTNHPRDRDAIEEWVKVHGTPEQRDEMMASLAGLPIGTAWVWSAGWLDVFKRVRIRERETFDSSATPKPGQRARAPKKLAEVDLAKVQERISATIERAKAEDPKELRRRIAGLERQLKARPADETKTRPADETKTETVVERVEVPVEIPVEVPIFDDDTLKRMEKALEPAGDVLGEIQELALKHRMAAEATLDRAREARNRPQARPTPAPRPQSPERAQRPPTVRTATPRPLPAASTEEDTHLKDTHLKAGARRVLETFARHYPMKMTRSQLGTLARFKITGGTFQTYFSQLKRLGLLQEYGGEIQITEAGLDYVGHVAQEPMTTEELLEMWRGALKAGARKMLDELVSVYPKGLSREDLALVTDMTVTGGTFQTYLATLRRNGLVEVDGDWITASDTLFLSGVPA